jgi:asparagine synthase (glutamine-hydrolysing)
VQVARAASLVGSFQRQSTPWQLALERPGLAVLYADTTAFPSPQVLEGNRGLILGVLFKSTNSGASNCGRAVLKDSDVDRVFATGGRALVEDFWGNYVAILDDGYGVRIVRGPASTLPCLHVHHESIHLYFSCMESVAQLNLRPFKIDWLAFARTLIGPDNSAKTSLEGVQEIRPGVCERIEGEHSSQEVLWDPIALSQRQPCLGWDDAAHALRTAIRRCVHQWASQHSRIVLGLSGGLDSSIVLASLADASSQPEIVCITHYADECGDERAYARMGCERAGVRLVEHRRSSNIDLATTSHTVRLETSPGLRIPAVDRIEPDLALREGATAIFRGDGGDEVSCRNRADLSLVDLVRESGLCREAIELAMHAATMEGRTAWSVLLKSLADAWFPRAWNFASVLAKDLSGATLLHPDVLAALQRDASPVSVHARGTDPPPPGRLFQIGLICARRPFYGPFTRLADPASVAPLLSQPVIEVCLRIPTYLQMVGRRDRALTRFAFAADVPTAIVQRRDKGGAEALAAAILARNLSYVREMILGGIILQQGIFDRARVEAALAEAPSADAVASVPVFDLLGAEIWARAWRL